ncbi:MAG: hypothetical protein N3E36_04550 [Sulfolobales archaeon]|nr:hypothetical protein [Sulfolobales archaeon]MCX8199285.1 hypothetical protein [Sulfolobales archaeon]MDW8170401.1 hypothetical protein [Desulfurococcaceae archaeon]
MAMKVVEEFKKVKKRFGLIRTVAFTVGLLLSPITWFNDPIVNVPIALALTHLLIKACGRELFIPIFAASYVFTNVLGLLLMQVSISYSGDKFRAVEILKIFIGTIVYTLLVIFLLRIGILNPP